MFETVQTPGPHSRVEVTTHRALTSTFEDSVLSAESKPCRFLCDFGSP